MSSQKQPVNNPQQKPRQFNTQSSLQNSSKDDDGIRLNSKSTLTRLSPQNVAQLQRTFGNRAIGRLIQERYPSTATEGDIGIYDQSPTTSLDLSAYPNSKTSKLSQDQMKLIQRDDIEFEVVEVPSHSGNIEDIATDSFRTMRAQLANFSTAVNNFGTAIGVESKEEAAPADPVITVISQIGDFAIDQLKDYATSINKGGKFLMSLVTLGLDIDKAIQTERQRSTAAGTRNAAANFIIKIRNSLATANANLESTMTEDIVAVRQEYNNATSDSQRQVIRFHLERINADITRKLDTVFSVGGLFTRITESWIAQTNAPGEMHKSRVYIKLDNNWNIVQAYLQAPFGSRLAEQLQNLGPLDLVNFNVPRVVMWYPNFHKKDYITNVTADLPPENNRIENLRSNLTGRYHLARFVELISTRPIPDTTKVSGSTTGS